MDTRSQYHHYIPRFILRRWAVDNPKSESSTLNGISVKPELLNVYHMAQESLCLGAETISRNFGIVDMYKDTSHEKDVYHIEKSLARLEEAASKVVSKLEMAVETSSGAVTLLRSELNTLRKFLFVMGFRNGRQYERWSDGLLESRTMDALRAFTAEHGLASTRDAYLLTLRQLLDTEHWKVTDNPKIFSATRDDYKMDKDQMTLAFYAAQPGVEFILNNHAFGIWQSLRGPAVQLAFQLAGQPMTKDHGLICTRLFPVTPKLALILRQTFMTLENEDPSFTPNVMGIPLGRSYFADLPFQRPKTEYNPPPRLVASDSKDPFAHLGGSDLLESRVLDRFTFPVLTLSTPHSLMINAMVLENCTGSIIFMNIIPLYKSILAYYRDTQVQHKADHTKLKKRLVEAHRASQLTVGSDLTQSDGAASGQSGAPTSPSAQNDHSVSSPKKKRRRKGKSISSGTTPADTVQPDIKDATNTSMDHPGLIRDDPSPNKSTLLPLSMGTKKHQPVAPGIGMAAISERVADNGKADSTDTPQLIPSTQTGNTSPKKGKKKGKDAVVVAAIPQLSKDTVAVPNTQSATFPNLPGTTAISLTARDSNIALPKKGKAKKRKSTSDTAITTV